MKPVSSVILFLLCVSYSAFGQNETCVFKGRVYSYGKGLKGATIEVYNTGNLILETSSNGSGKFQLELEPEKQYMVEISMENLRTKIIWINTGKTKDLEYKVPAFGFDVYLKKEKTGPYDELSEIPVTLVKFQPEKKAFYMDKTYEDALESKKMRIKENTLMVR